MNGAITPNDLMTVDEVVGKWPQFFSRNQLHEAMRRGEIKYYKNGRSRSFAPHCISDYLESHMVDICPEKTNSENSRLVDIGSAKKKIQTTITAAGDHTTILESAAEASALQILNRPKKY